ncbi:MULTISPECIES: TetR/AcrR family transcriptional regulator [Yersiniaceae]|uniref:TetR/AcrR family transcriptional regulator n=3 Tax=Yersiniaceae TaxID=1903411 RepID=A0A2N5EJ59_9GAMM|nr:MULTISPECIES: TetR/AcrR family transcriptional regulator [Yersiniaceae]MBS0969136.1 TetR/AcrR family transcriptional regulator [Nissabacter archeti]MDV5141602.1 TetR/AcrR family transcriptional regulator [Chimaeribacter arupi]PLR45444.1 TetR/AcrR family transcriptional regulator [Chimaeribacter arupi]
MKPGNLQLQPRKMPVQSRSEATVDAILEATLQVLIADGLERCTTTRVAERAGVSVGTLYQYFPHKQSLLNSLLARHLNDVSQAVIACCAEQHGTALQPMISALVSTYLEAKFARPEASRALYVIAMDHGGEEILQQVQDEMRGAVSALLSSAADASFTEADTVAVILITSLAGVLCHAVGSDAAASPDALYPHLNTLGYAYVKAYAVER